jgi:ABC-2 type transport system permease protein
MLRNVFLKTLRDQRRSLLWWALGLVAYGTFIMLFWPSVADFEGLDEFMDQYPEDLMALFAGDVKDIGSPEGYLEAEVFFIFAPLLFIIFATAAGSGAIAGEEGQGTLDLLVSNPVSRRQVVLQKFEAMVVAALVLAFAFWLALAIAALAVGMEIGTWHLAAAVLSAALLGIAFGAVALAVGCATGNRGLSIVVAAVAAVVAYMLNALGPVVEPLEPLGRVSPFYYYIRADPLANGLHLGHASVLAALAAALLAVALYTFDRRDLGV